MKPYSCNICRRLSLRVINWLFKRYQTGIKPYPSQLCKQSFTQCSNMYSPNKTSAHGLLLPCRNADYKYI